MRLLILCLCVAVLPCCSSPKKKEPTQGMTRFQKMLQMPSPDKKSPFDTEFNTGKNGKGNFFTNKSFKTGKFDGLKDYKTQDFSQGTKGNRWGTKAANWGGRESNFANKTFGTKDNRMSGQMAQMGDQSFSGSDSTYKTGEFQPGTKSLQRDLRPQIYGSPNDSTPAYSEEDIGRMINR
jgi:hypothetical protein